MLESNLSNTMLLYIPMLPLVIRLFHMGVLFLINELEFLDEMVNNIWKKENRGFLSV
jgi:hypothetical protein